MWPRSETVVVFPLVPVTPMTSRDPLGSWWTSGRCGPEETADVLDDDLVGGVGVGGLDDHDRGAAVERIGNEHPAVVAQAPDRAERPPGTNLARIVREVLDRDVVCPPEPAADGAGQFPGGDVSHSPYPAP